MDMDRRSDNSHERDSALKELSKRHEAEKSMLDARFRNELMLLEERFKKMRILIETKLSPRNYNRQNASNSASKDGPPG